MKLRLIAAVTAVSTAAVSAFVPSAHAATSEVEFNGTVPSYCTIANSPTATTLTYDSTLNRLSANSTDFNFVSNSGVNVNLSQVTVLSAPANTNGYSWFANLWDSSNAIVVSSSNTAASSTPYTSSTPLSSANTFKMNFMIRNGSSGAPMLAGTYSGKVTIDCTAS